MVRDETEWAEPVEHGFNTLPDLTKCDMLSNYQQMTTDKIDWNKRLFGDGHAAK